ncbi:serine aminopeptidase domain-containing protein [Neobacillus rhizophilus]|uniref:Hydrolase n=1 Tax=Neobacillus rhizophilus TaxID=2833579 RepID=A0A942YTG8_9BACI|nr:alpha/beta hydrolase [Neobacillus rhizophilus]MBS4212159.1 hydrolase [Neobacillus rhizophilus]MBU8915589.1 hydrolase [Bacillus sp. FJAT-29953]
MECRSFQMDSQWNIIYYPEKPTGFGVLVIGDERHFVDESKSFWTQNEGKQIIINDLKEKGYTIFSSNLYGRNWGSDNAVELAQSLYQHVIRSEILNQKIHILAEGMGALVALKLMEKMKDNIRSVILLNPVLSLKYHLQQEKEHKFFYKKLIRELVAAYQTNQQDLESAISKMDDIVNLNYDCPIQIIHILAGGRSYNQSKQYQQILGPSKINPTFILLEKKQQLGKICAKFLSSHESVL